MLSDMIASVKKAESDADVLVAQSKAKAEELRRQANDEAADMLKRTREKAKSAAAKALFDKEALENALDEREAAAAERTADALRKKAQQSSGALTDKVREIMFA